MPVCDRTVARSTQSSSAPLFARQPAQTRSNPRRRRHKLGQCDRRPISANFPCPEGSISFDSFDSFDFRPTRRYDVTTKTITIEFDIIEHRVPAKSHGFSRILPGLSRYTFRLDVGADWSAERQYQTRAKFPISGVFFFFCCYSRTPARVFRRNILGSIGVAQSGGLSHDDDRSFSSRR